MKVPSLRKMHSYVTLNCLLAVLQSFLFISTGFAGNGVAIAFKDKSKQSDSCFIDHENGIITDIETGLMWTKMDSYADLGKCLNWNESKIYVSDLRTGGYRDWRMPEEKELKSIYDKSQWNKMSFDHNYPIHLDKIFEDGAAYWYWLLGSTGSCCARILNFLNGAVNELKREHCFNMGVRAVRNV